MTFLGTAGLVATGRAIGVGADRDEQAAALLDRSQQAIARLVREATALPGIGRLARPVVDSTAGHGALRMVAVDDAIAAAIAPDMQVVIVGAGLDTRAWRLPAFAAHTVYEVDRPVLQNLKRARADALGQPRGRLVYVPADLEIDALDEVLASAGHRADGPTLWLWEAVMMYLRPAAAATTLEAMARRSGPGSTLVLTWCRRDLGLPALARVALGPVVQAAFGAVGEPLRCLLDAEELRTMLAQTGWQLQQSTGPTEWTRLLTAPRNVRDLFAAEQLAVATLGQARPSSR